MLLQKGSSVNQFTTATSSTRLQFWRRARALVKRNTCPLYLHVVKTPVSLALCKSSLTATRYTVYSVPGCRFLRRYLVAEGPTLYVRGWPPLVGPAVSLYPEMMARGRVHNTSTECSVVLMNLRLVGASSSGEEKAQHASVFQLSPTSPQSTFITLRWGMGVKWSCGAYNSRLGCVLAARKREGGSWK